MKRIFGFLGTEIFLGTMIARLSVLQPYRVIRVQWQILSKTNLRF